MEILGPEGAIRLGAGVAGAALGVGAVGGDRVVFAVPGSAALVAGVLGVLRAGMVPVVLDPAAPREELAQIVADADPVLVLDSAERLEGAAAHAPVDQQDVPLGRPMHYTSGTTGRRKGVASGVLSADLAAALWAEERDLWGFTAADRHVVLSPLYHSAPLRFAIGTLLAGGDVVLPGKFSVPAFLAATDHHPTTTFTAPAQLGRLREAGDPRISDALRRFRLIAHAGAPCPEVDKRWLIDLVGADPVWEFYGSTEGQFTACPARDWLEHPGSVGRARPGRKLSVDEDGRIWCAVPEHARFAYWRDEAKTTAAWREGPHGPEFTVGDHGELDDEGYLTLLGRRDDLVISGGVNVYPAEVERVLSEVAGVDEVIAFGVDDERWGQRVEVAIRGRVTVESIDAHAREHLPPARRPRAVHVLPLGEDYPRTSTGKVLRRTLPEVYRKG